MPLPISFQDAVALFQRGQSREAETLCRTILQRNPRHAESLYLLGLIATEKGNFRRAVEMIGKAIKLAPEYPPAHGSLGNALNELGRRDEALESYNRALQLNPSFAEIYVSRGYTLNELGRPHEAVDSLEMALVLNPDLGQAHSNLAHTLNGLKRHSDALAHCDKALAIDPQLTDAYVNRGVALLGLMRLKAALESYDIALSQAPDLAAAHLNRGIALLGLAQPAAALISLDNVIARRPNLSDAYVYRAEALLALARLEEAAASYKRALALAPDKAYLRGYLLHAQMTLCDWSDFTASSERIRDGILTGRGTSTPFPVLSLFDSSDLHRRSAAIYTQLEYPENLACPIVGQHPKGDKIRLGYFSADFHNHATSNLMAGLFECHDRSAFEITAYSFGPDDSGPMRKRLVSSFNNFVDASRTTDQVSAQMARDAKIDIAIDLKGFTFGCRPGIFAQRAAPVQVSYIGYPGTMSAGYIDYLIADPTLIPESQLRFYQEKIAYLPHSYQANDRARAISERVFTRAEADLPEQGFVYCCFNANYKILPTMFDTWMNVLRRRDGSVLWLLEGNPVAAANLRKEASRRDIDPSRLIFAPRMPLGEHLARHRLADLFLDTLPYNAHTTASDALWAGLPVLTLIGESFPARVSASLLHAVGLPDFIVTSRDQYESMAVELGGNPTALANIKGRMAAHRATALLFDTPLFTRHIEAAYGAMMQRCWAGLPPDHIIIT